MSHSCKNKSYDTCKWVMSRVCSLSLRPSLGIFSRTMYDTCKWWVDMTHVNESYVSRVTCENESCDTTCENHFHIWISLCETCGLMSHTWRVRMSCVTRRVRMSRYWVVWVVLESCDLYDTTCRSWEWDVQRRVSMSRSSEWVVHTTCEHESFLRTHSQERELILTLRVGMSRSWVVSYNRTRLKWTRPCRELILTLLFIVDASFQWKLSLDWSNAFDQTVSWMSIQLWVV